MMRSSSEEQTATGGGSDWSATTIDVISTPHAQGKNGIITVRNSDIETIFRKRVRKIQDEDPCDICWDSGLSSANQISGIRHSSVPRAAATAGTARGPQIPTHSGQMLQGGTANSPEDDVMQSLQQSAHS